MKSQNQRLLPLLLFCLSSLGLGGPVVAESRPGVVIEQVGPGSALEKAGIRPGDLLFAWEREGGQGDIGTIFDWLWVKAEQAPRAGLRLRGEREGIEVAFDIPRGFEWDARARPWMATELLQTYTEGRRRIESGDVEGGVSLWSDLARRSGPDLECWLLLEISETWSKSGQGDKARSALQSALERAPDAETQVEILEALGQNHQRANQMAEAEACFRSALKIGEAAWGESLRVAGTITKWIGLLILRSQLDAAEQLQQRALEIRQRWAPDSLELAESLNQSLDLSLVRGDVEAASGMARRALELFDRWSPGGLAVTYTLNDFAILAMERGHLDEASAALLRALAILEQRAPDSLILATVLSQLGEVARRRSDLEAATELLQRALSIREKLAPESIGTAAVLGYLGATAWNRDDLAAAQELFQRALAIREKAAPQGIGTASMLDALGTTARLRGDLDAAWTFHRRALEIYEKISPGGLYVALALKHLGEVAEMRGDLNRAIDLYLQAQAIFEVRAPGTIDHALALLQLGRLHHRTQRIDLAAHELSQAVDALDSQTGRLGGSQELRATVLARYQEIYRDAIDIELERGHATEAFHLVERSRARSFLALLMERDLELYRELPAGLDRSRRDNAMHYDQTLRKLASWAPAAGEAARESLLHELGRLRQERDEIAAEIRKASPKLADLRQPQSLDLAGARKVLDPGTVALSYSVGETRTALFAVTRDGGLQVKTLPFGEKKLRQDVERFLEHVRQPGPDGETAALARSLYQSLIAPAAGLIGKSERVLILPDGPLHRLPFGALVRTTNGRDQYLIEWKPLHTALSLTVYGALRDSRRDEALRPPQLVAFGDPHYPKGLATSEATRAPSLRNWRDLRGLDWTPLPYSRREVERIAGVYPESRLFLGENATEDQAKAVASQARVLHFATHGYLDDRVPLDSALVLTIPEQLSQGRDNGLLQVWEIFEGVRLDADLVVLSGCETALGRELSGEGMIGLTRAFQYAGARSVVASLWSVTDQLTAELMTRFHRHYATGLSKDEALRQAQIELIRQPVRITTANGQTVEMDASAPFFWAAFQVFGDWR